jgi:hypothetical protein
MYKISNEIVIMDSAAVLIALALEHGPMMSSILGHVKWTIARALLLTFHVLELLSFSHSAGTHET